MRYASKQFFKPLLLAASFLLTQPSLAKDIQIDIKPIDNFLATKPAQKIFGKLEFLGGAELTSPNEDFGGLSAIEFRNGSKKFTAITDKARFITGKITREDNRVTQIKDATLTRVRNAKGKIITGADDKDSEAITFKGEQIILGYERNDRIAFFNEKKQKLTQDKKTPSIDLNPLGFPNNKGVEAIALAPNAKTLFIFAEHALNQEGNHRGFSVKNGNIEELSIKVPDGYSITDAAFLPDGRLILLERYYSIFSGAHMRIRRFAKADEISSKAVLKGETLIEANARYEIDNMEGLSITTMQDGATRLTLISDDNFSRNQRTLLLEFKLLD